MLNAECFHFLLATAEGGGGIGVVELYGPGAEAALARLFRSRHGRPLREGEVRLGTIADATGDEIDEILLARVPAAASWCRVPSWSISTHGGSMVRRRMRECLAGAGGIEIDCAGAIGLARSQGVLSKTEGDALLLLPDARTERAARFLVRSAAGDLDARIGAALAALDSGDETRARGMLEALLDDAVPARRLLEPRRILLAGRPNAGKSSLFNRLVVRERAAVTAVPGTTRDLLEEEAAVAGFPVVFVDGAGLRPGGSEDPVEHEGMRRVREAAGDCVLFLIDRPGPPEPDEAEFMESVPSARLLIVRTKSDLRDRPGPPPVQPGAAGSRTEAASVSAITGEGLPELRDRIRAEWLGPPEDIDLPPAPFTEGQVESARRAFAAASEEEMRSALAFFLGPSRKVS
jgi:tRNA modification GTPase